MQESSAGLIVMQCQISLAKKHVTKVDGLIAMQCQISVKTAGEEARDKSGLLTD